MVCRVRRRGRRRAALALGAILLLSLAAALGCGVFTVLPMDEVRGGNPAGRLLPYSHEPYRSGEIVFSHAPHSFAPCESCHLRGSAPEEVRASGLPSMARCLECHNGEQASSACETCHQLERRNRKPPTHDGLWQRRHGESAYFEAYQCALCHHDNQCQGCHALRKPQSHTLRWERSAHGREAIHNRFTCATCHEADFCENCHSHPPPDHTTTFMTAGGHKQVARLRARSCLTCHRFESDCARCHGGP